MAKTVFKIDLNKKPEQQTIKTHNRWHPDLPMVEMFKPGDEFRVECPHSTGDEWPTPGRATFQLISAAVQLPGMPSDSLSPVPLGPRNRVHSCAETKAGRISHSASHRERMTSIRRGGAKRGVRLMVADAAGRFQVLPWCRIVPPFSERRGPARKHGSSSPQRDREHRGKGEGMNALGSLSVLSVSRWFSSSLDGGPLVECQPNPICPF